MPELTMRITPNSPSANDPVVSTSTNSTPRIALKRVNTFDLMIVHSGREVAGSGAFTCPRDVRSATSAEVSPVSGSVDGATAMEVGPDGGASVTAPLFQTPRIPGMPSGERADDPLLREEVGHLEHAVGPVGGRPRGVNDPAVRHSTPSMTSVDLMRTVAGLPASRPSSSTASLVIDAVTTWSPPSSFTLTDAMTAPTETSVMVPVSWLRVDRRMRTPLVSNSFRPR